MRTSRRLVGLGAVGVLLLCACTSDPDPTPSGVTTSAGDTASTSPTASPTPSAGPSESASGDDVAPAGFDLEDVAGGGFPELGDDIGPGAGVRVGRHSDYDRVVFDFADSGSPSYVVRYVDSPVADGSGDVVAVEGDAYLEVLVTRVSIPQDGVTPPADPSPADLQGTVVAEAKAIFGGFEGYGQSFIGVTGQQRPFRVSVESSPTRLVIDVSH